MSAPALTPIYTCRICRRAFTVPNHPPIIGETAQSRLSKVGQMLTEHLQTEHKEAFVQIALAGQQYAGWLFMEQFTHSDAELSTESNKVRLQLRKITRRVQISDEVIEKQIETHLEEMSPFPEMRQKVIALLKTMRDSLEESA